jgi:hypothetical protein
MRAVPLKAAAQYVGGLVIAAFFVLLLSFTFSFLGTLFCAALGGMMLGALRTHKWQAVPVSLLFPLVIFALLKGMKTELAGRQVLLVALACFGTFWLIYGLAATLFFFERKGVTATAHTNVGRPAPGALPERELAPHPSAIDHVSVPKRNGWLNLEMLQGNWTGEANGDPQFQSRRISFQEDWLTLFGVDSTGQSKLLAKAEVSLCSSPRRSQLWEPAPEPASDTLVSI